jgi:hypothetical protein
MIDIRYSPPTPTVPGKVSLPISAAYSGGLLFTIPVEINDMPIGGRMSMHRHFIFAGAFPAPPASPIRELGRRGHLGRTGQPFSRSIVKAMVEG